MWDKTKITQLDLKILIIVKKIIRIFLSSTYVGGRYLFIKIYNLFLIRKDNKEVTLIRINVISNSIEFE